MYTTVRHEPRFTLRSLILLSLGCLLVEGCGQEVAVEPAQANQMVYYDRGTKKALVYNISREFPVIHPGTGKPTLVPATYCSQCKKWFPAPPLEVRERSPKAMQCPANCGTTMTLDGPWPEETL